MITATDRLPSSLRLPAARMPGPQNDANSSSQPSNDGGVDWDDAWARYQQQTRTGPGGSRATTRTATPGGSPNTTNSSRSRPIDPMAQQVRGAIRKDENLLLDLWSNGWFQGAMMAVAALVLISLVVAAGPPPVDDRCTLPWC